MASDRVGAPGRFAADFVAVDVVDAGDNVVDFLVLADELGDKGADGRGLAVGAVVDRGAQKAVLVDRCARLDDAARVEGSELGHCVVHGGGNARGWPRGSGLLTAVVLTSAPRAAVYRPGRLQGTSKPCATVCWHPLPLKNEPARQRDRGDFGDAGAVRL